MALLIISPLAGFDEKSDSLRGKIRSQTWFTSSSQSLKAKRGSKPFPEELDAVIISPEQLSESIHFR